MGLISSFQFSSTMLLFDNSFYTKYALSESSSDED